MVTVLSSPLGDRVKRLRKSRNLTQGQLARYAKVGRSWVSIVESGELLNPGSGRLDKLAVYFGVTSRYLLTGKTEEEEMVPAPPEIASVFREMLHYGADAIREAEIYLRIRSTYPKAPESEARQITEAEAERPADPDKPQADFEGPSNR